MLIALTAPFLGRYGWDRDELYFLTASRHLDFGYVDFPPLVAVLAAGGVRSPADVEALAAAGAEAAVVGRAIISPS